MADETPDAAERLAVRSWTEATHGVVAVVYHS
jgi:hypothetical protein